MATSGDSRRRYVRHTVGVPLEVERLGEAPPSGTSPPHAEAGVNVSQDGLAFLSSWCPQVGDVLQLRIPTVDPPFEAQGRVTWCRPEAGRFLVGIQFLDRSDAFRSRMVQQVCAIEQYRQEIREHEGRDLDTQAAAAEWIAKYAGRFPALSDGGEPRRE